MANPSKSNTTITFQFQTAVLQRQISTDSARTVGKAEVIVEACFGESIPPSRLAFSYQLAFGSHRGDFLELSGLRESNSARLAMTSKTQEMAAFSTFLRFLKWKMDGKWEMENAHRMATARLWCSSGILFFVAHTFMSTKIKCPHCELPAVRLRLMDGYKFCCARCRWNHQIVQRELSSARNDVCGNARADIYYDYPPREVVIIKNG